MKDVVRRSGRVISIAAILCMALASVVFAASSVTINAPADGATSLTGSVTLDTGAGATVDTGHTYQVDGGTAQALTVTGTSFSVPVSSLADGSHTVSVSIMVDEDGAGAGTPVARTTSRTFTIASGAVDVATGTGLTFTIPTAGIGPAVSDSLTSLSPLFLIAAGLVIGGSALGWGISMLKKWRGAR